MKQVTRNISLDLSRKNNTRVIFASEADYNSREFIISLFDDGAPYEIDATAFIAVNVKRPDGEARSYEAEITEDGRIRYLAKRWDLDVPGDVLFSVSLYGDDDIRLTSTFFTVKVEEGVYVGAEVTEEDEVYGAFSEMMKSLAGIKSEEVKRVYAENQRINNENARADAEKNRINDEKQRRNAEIARLTGEEERISEEAARVAAEETRSVAEGSSDPSSPYYGGRGFQEAIRCAGENAREDAEIIRASEEEKRRIAEGSTYSGDPYYGGRQIQELLRQENESARISAERERADSENARNDAENTRIANENARSEITSMMKTTLENLIALQEGYIAKGAAT